MRRKRQAARTRAWGRSAVHTLKAFGQLHRFHQLLGDVVGVQTAQLLLPEQLQKEQNLFLLAGRVRR